MDIAELKTGNPKNVGRYPVHSIGRLSDGNAVFSRLAKNLEDPVKNLIGTHSCHHAVPLNTQ